MQCSNLPGINNYSIKTPMRRLILFVLQHLVQLSEALPRQFLYIREVLGMSVGQWLHHRSITSGGAGLEVAFFLRIMLDVSLVLYHFCET